MIYTVTLNPAVDYVVNIDTFHSGEINRSQFDYKEAGGKGINVSRVLERFGEKTTALGFIGGFTGEFITNVLSVMHIKHDFVSLEQDTRINLKLKTTTEESEINGVSPKIEKEDYQNFLTKLQSLKEGDLVVLAGSLPDSLPEKVYQEIVEILQDHGVVSFLDTSGPPLIEAIKASPTFVKPNHHELAELFGETVKTEQDMVRLAKRLYHGHNIPHVLISMAKEGAIYVGKDGVCKLSAPIGKTVNSVGAGDSSVAGFLYKWKQTNNAKEAARYAVAAGSATAFSKTLCTKEEVETLLTEVKISSIPI